MALLINDPCEDFTTAPWVVTGTPSVAAGHTGNGFTIPYGTGNTVSYNLAAPAQTDLLVFGANVRFSALSPIDRTWLSLRSDDGATAHCEIKAYNGDGYLYVWAGGSPVGAIGIDTGTWYLVEVAIKLHDTLGRLHIRINGVTSDVCSPAADFDTKNGGTKTVFDQVRLTGIFDPGTYQVDNIYIRNDATFGAAGTVTGTGTAALALAVTAAGTVHAAPVVTGTATATLALAAAATGTVVPASGIVAGTASVTVSLTAHAVGTRVPVTPPVIPGSGLAEALVEFEDQFGDWVDITCDVRSIDISSGRQQVLEQFRAGTLTLTMANFEGVNSAWPPDSIWAQAGPRRTNVPIRVSMVRGGVTHRLFTGTTDAVNDSWPRTVDAMVSVLASDGFKDLARYDDLGQPPARWSDDFEVQESGALEPTGEWCDYFERADGPLGADWDDETLTFDPLDGFQPFSISGGAAVCEGDPSGGSLQAFARALPPAGDVAEIVLTDYAAAMTEAGCQVQLFTHLDAAGTTAASMYFEVDYDDAWEYWWDLRVYDAHNSPEVLVNGGPIALPGTVDDPLTIRLESDGDDHRCYLNGALLGEATSSVPAGTFAGFSFTWEPVFPGDPPAPIPGPPRVESFCGGPS